MCPITILDHQSTSAGHQAHVQWVGYGCRTAHGRRWQWFRAATDAVQKWSTAEEAYPWTGLVSSLDGHSRGLCPHLPKWNEGWSSWQHWSGRPHLQSHGSQFHGGPLDLRSATVLPAVAVFCVRSCLSLLVETKSRRRGKWFSRRSRFMSTSSLFCYTWVRHVKPARPKRFRFRHLGVQGM